VKGVEVFDKSVERVEGILASEIIVEGYVFILGPI
jgi:hypothetical protein